MACFMVRRFASIHSWQFAAPERCFFVSLTHGLDQKSREALMKGGRLKIPSLEAIEGENGREK
jgi:hypothetical protein